MMRINPANRKDTDKGLILHYLGGERCKNSYNTDYNLHRQFIIHLICSYEENPDVSIDPTYRGENCHVFLYIYAKEGCGQPLH
jgi:hypothetical protein|mmetsp:Transcript_4127/g.546  ORF Transcript_4127/g.546 Transcript_4127/m.546 type:complete len:83 (+) Transcript_4127:141-389(+)